MLIRAADLFCCQECGAPAPSRGGRRYCGDPCRTAAANRRRRERVPVVRPRRCRRCGAEFSLTRDMGHNRQYCSNECARHALRRSTASFYRNHPEAMASYNRARYWRHGADTLITRLRRRYPDLPTTCEAAACEEGRVLEAAHRPEFRRHGAWRTMDRYERHMFWMLCPTHHALLDRGVCSQVELGLPPLVEVHQAEALCFAMLA